MGDTVEHLRLTADESERITTDPDRAWNHRENVRSCCSGMGKGSPWT
jgi:hypothetical protein